ncbi:MAG: spore protease YyaC [Bacillota bacterium]
MGLFRNGPREIQCRTHVDDSRAPDVLAEALHSLVSCDMSHPSAQHLLFFCIGTDRSTGDALGPLTGTRLISLGIDEARVWGTLDAPVHAANLHVAMERARVTFGDPYVIAIDACLGRLENVGVVSVSRGPLKPGTGVSKALPPVGNIHVTGIVNVGGYMEYLVLQNTRLCLVMRMAEVIATALAAGTREFLAPSSTFRVAERFAATKHE